MKKLVYPVTLKYRGDVNDENPAKGYARWKKENKELVVLFTGPNTGKVVKERNVGCGEGYVGTSWVSAERPNWVKYKPVSAKELKRAKAISELEIYLNQLNDIIVKLKDTIATLK